MRSDSAPRPDARLSDLPRDPHRTRLGAYTLDRFTRMDYASKTQAKVLGVVFLALAALMAWGLADYVSEIVKASAARAWPTATAKILISRAQTGCSKGSSFYPFVKYEYSVALRRYTGNRIAFGHRGCGAAAFAERIASQFPVGATVLVHFNPATPRESVLVAGRVHFDTWLAVIVMFVVLVGCIGFVVAAVYQAKRNSSSS